MLGMAFIPAVQAAGLPAEHPAVSAITYIDVAQAGARLVAVGDRGNIIYSDDGAATWQQASTPTNALLTAVCFGDDNTGWAVGHDAVVLNTTDGGQTWSLQYSDILGEGAAEEGEDYADDGAYEEYGDPYGDPYAYDEGDAVEETVDTSGAPFLDVWCYSAEKAVAVGGFGYFIETEDGGASWNKRMDDLRNADGWHIYGYAPVPETDTILMVGEKGTMYRSRNGGNTWESLKSPYEGSFFGVTAIGPGQAVAYGLQGNVWVTRDQGSTWRKVKTGVTRAINAAVVLDDGTVVLAGASGVILVSHDNMSSAALQYLADRETVSSLLPIDGDKLLMVGEAGAKVVGGIR